MTRPAVFAKDRLAQSKGRLGHGAVGALRCRDDNGFDQWVADKGLPIIRGPRESVGLAITLRTVGGAGADHLQTRPQRSAENGPYRRHGHCVGFTHIAATKNPDANFSHSHAPFPVLELQPVAKSVSSVAAHYKPQSAKSHGSNQHPDRISFRALGSRPAHS